MPISVFLCFTAFLAAGVTTCFECNAMCGVVYSVATVHIVSRLEPAFFVSNLVESGVSSALLARRLHCHTRTLDSGAVQRGALEVDRLATLYTYLTLIHAHRASLLAFETAFLLSLSTSASTSTPIPLTVLVDATPLACVAGREAGARVLIVSNFTWDTIYTSLLTSLLPPTSTSTSTSTTEVENSVDSDMDMDMDMKVDMDLQHYRDMISQCSLDYCRAHLYLQLPAPLPPPPLFSPSPTACPLVCREARTARHLTRSSLLHHLHPTSTSTSLPSRILVLTFGGFDTSTSSSTSTLKLRNDMLPDNWTQREEERKRWRDVGTCMGRCW